eukprot:g544.t1
MNCHSNLWKSSLEIKGMLKVKVKGVVDSWPDTLCSYDMQRRVFSFEGAESGKRRLKDCCWVDVADRPGRMAHRFDLLEIDKNNDSEARIELAASSKEEKRNWTASMVAEGEERSRLCKQAEKDSQEVASEKSRRLFDRDKFDYASMPRGSAVMVNVHCYRTPSLNARIRAAQKPIEFADEADQLGGSQGKPIPTAEKQPEADSGSMQAVLDSLEKDLDASVDLVIDKTKTMLEGIEQDLDAGIDAGIDALADFVEEEPTLYVRASLLKAPPRDSKAVISTVTKVAFPIEAADDDGRASTEVDQITYSWSLDKGEALLLCEHQDIHLLQLQFFAQESNEDTVMAALSSLSQSGVGGEELLDSNAGQGIQNKATNIGSWRCQLRRRKGKQERWTDEDGAADDECEDELITDGRKRWVSLDGGGRALIAVQVAVPVTNANVKLGLRVSRGLHWQSGDQDGGKGALGTVVGYKLSDGAAATGSSPRALPSLHAVVKWDLPPLGADDAATGICAFYSIGSASGRTEESHPLYQLALPMRDFSGAGSTGPSDEVYEEALSANTVAVELRLQQETRKAAEELDKKQGRLRSALRANIAKAIAAERHRKEEAQKQLPAAPKTEQNEHQDPDTLLGVFGDEIDALLIAAGITSAQDDNGDNSSDADGDGFASSLVRRVSTGVSDMLRIDGWSDNDAVQETHEPTQTNLAAAHADAPADTEALDAQRLLESIRLTAAQNAIQLGEILLESLGEDDDELAKLFSKDHDGSVLDECETPPGTPPDEVEAQHPAQDTDAAMSSEAPPREKKAGKTLSAKELLEAERGAVDEANRLLRAELQAGRISQGEYDQLCLVNQRALANNQEVALAGAVGAAGAGFGR